ncbi:HAD family hydrolase [Lichenihabitans sp. Uapishka_5]|uniref:HAD family hydrolase n=1 Tax=Lichenihabitans sp. Uapishka_5 TaxID=3037302 RepID=UPI0029E7F7CF|nr:HAD family hydrolase [Lichenihabitans sp. Uapishka_5]MDX7949720.1 HAD family hydrolase [Lichenihabitans sp. Uapishka_5]
MLDAVIFDVDGTLVDSVDLHAEAWSRAFAHFGWTVETAQARGQIGKGGDQLLPVFLPDDAVERQGKEIEAYRKTLFAQDYLHKVKGFPQVRALFERLLNDGKRIALASSAKGDELEAYKKAAGIADLDLSQTSSDDAEKSKPHPDIFLAALDRLKLPAKTCVVVGDTPFDAEAALKAGVRTTGVLCGGFPEFDLRAGGASQIYADPADLLDHYKRWMTELG